MKEEILEVINEEGETLYEATRKDIHTKGLLHKEIHIWLFTPERKLIFQHRSKTKDTFPDKLDASVGGHVDLGESYEEAVLRECKEELGIDIESIDDVTFIMTAISNSADEVTHTINHPRRNTYAYCYRGDVKDLKTELGQSQGFVVYDINSLFTLSDEEKKKFVPGLVTAEYKSVYKKILSLI